MMLFSNTYKIKKKPSEYEFDIDTVQAEFLFLLDRSGSMDGTRIENAIKTLQIFL